MHLNKRRSIQECRGRQLAQLDGRSRSFRRRASRWRLHSYIQGKGRGQRNDRVSELRTKWPGQNDHQWSDSLSRAYNIDVYIQATVQSLRERCCNRQCITHAESRGGHGSIFGDPTQPNPSLYQPNPTNQPTHQKSSNPNPTQSNPRPSRAAVLVN